MRLPAFLHDVVVHGKEPSFLRAIDRSPVRYSDSPGLSLDNPVVITGAEHDLMGTMAILAWLIRKRGTMGIDWWALVKRGHHDEHRHGDTNEIQLKTGARETSYFDVTDSFGGWTNLGPA